MTPASRIGEVGGGRGRERLREVLLEVAGEARLAGPRRPGRERAADGGVEQADAARGRAVSSSTLTSMPAVLPSSAPPTDLDLDVGPLALGQVADRVGRALRAREQHLVVVDVPSFVLSKI